MKAPWCALLFGFLVTCFASPSQGAPGRLACDSAPSQVVRARVQFRPTHETSSGFVGSVFLAIAEDQVETFRTYADVDLFQEDKSYKLYVSDGSLVVDDPSGNQMNGRLIYFGTQETYTLTMDCVMTP